MVKVFANIYSIKTQKCFDINPFSWTILHLAIGVCHSLQQYFFKYTLDCRNIVVYIYRFMHISNEMQNAKYTLLTLRTNCIKNERKNIKKTKQDSHCVIVISSATSFRESKRSRQTIEQASAENHKPVKIAKTNGSNTEENIPKLQYITVGDFDTVPR